MDFAQLSSLREAIDERVREMRETEGPALRERFAEAAAALGLSLEELVAANASAAAALPSLRLRSDGHGNRKDVPGLLRYSPA